MVGGGSGGTASCWGAHVLGRGRGCIEGGVARDDLGVGVIHSQEAAWQLRSLAGSWRCHTAARGPRSLRRWALEGVQPERVALNARFRGVQVTGVRLMPDCVSVHVRVTETPELRQHVQQDAADAAARAAAAAVVAAAPKVGGVRHDVVRVWG